MISDETRGKWKGNIEAIIEADNCGQVTLNEWESGFINSIYEQVFSGKDLSFKQSRILSKIYEKIL